jgi:sugar transferase (PEP-CTERM/EpsH1 system associated)
MGSTKINILHLIQGLEVGGLEYMTVSLLKGLDRTRYQTSVCCYDTLGSLAQAFNGSINIHYLKRKHGIDYSYPFKLANLLKKERIQILHLHNSTAFFYGVIAGKVAGVPAIVYTEHARDVFPNVRVKIADKILSLFTDKVIVVADFLKKNLVRYERFNPSKIMTIYNGIDEARFRLKKEPAEIKRELGIPAFNRIIGIVARLDPIKNHKSLITAMHTVIKEFPSTALLIIGDGPLRDELVSFVRERRLEEHIKFLGIRNDVPRLLSVLDIFVLCSVSEGLPLTLLEAMAAGKPIIATNVGGIPEVVDHNSNGLLIPPDDTEALSDAIVELLRDREKAGKLGMMAKRKFESNFSLSTMVKKYEEVYDSLLPNVLKGGSI